jgi:transposase
MPWPSAPRLASPAAFNDPEASYASGEVDWTGRISKCGDGLVRTYLFEAAGVPLLRREQ